MLSDNSNRSSRKTVTRLKKQVSNENEESVDLSPDTVHSEENEVVEEYRFDDDLVASLLNNKEFTYESTDRFISRIPDLYLIRSHELLECSSENVNDLALKTVLDVLRNNKFGWVPVGIAAYSVWLKADKQSGGAGKVAPLGEGKVNALKQFAVDIKEKGGKVEYKTLYTYVQLINGFFASTADQSNEEDEKSVLQKRTDLLKKLFLLPQGILRAALKSDNPKELLNKAYEERELNGDKTYTVKEINKEILERRESNQPIPTGVDEINNGSSLPVVVNVDKGPVNSVNFFGFDKAIALYVKNEARRIKIDPEVMMEVIISFQNHILLSASNYFSAGTNGN